MSSEEFSNAYAGKRVLVTGHTGFKGSWLVVWLRELGAEVAGYALAPRSSPNHFEACGTAEGIAHLLGDVRDAETLGAAFKRHQPEFVFHLAAQALVRDSYDDPKGTFDTNVGGTVNVLDAARKCDSVRAVVVVTSDKCYENREWLWGYRENDPVGGHDPYSASKGCAELVTASFLRSFFSRNGAPGVASARAGNVIGGGDWAQGRLLPDCLRALSGGLPIEIRNPRAVRPWQHVLEPLSGYLCLGTRLASAPADFRGAWNFGPRPEAVRPVASVAEAVVRAWGEGSWKNASEAGAAHEAHLLQLCSDKALAGLGWHATWDFEKTLRCTVDWYREYYCGAGEMRRLTVRQIREYVSDAVAQRLPWAGGPRIQCPAITKGPG